ncbi:MAG TPA: protein-L-isoaspartate O-methyltransferase [Beijerinckiaceae bacterium]|nr:protein-L-isoaspartate O-methyltransferase [Beijerinckiaceae bacterium]
MLDFAQARRAMVDSQLRTFDVFDIPVLAAMEAVPRERFVPPGRESLAYIDQDIPVSDGIAGAERRFMLKPMVLGRMIQALEVEAGARALDVASGLGYSAAVLARLGAHVAALESTEAAAEAARQRLASLGIENVAVVSGPLDQGYPHGAPYDIVLVNGLIEVRPQRLLNQLADGGRLACVERRGRAGRAVLYVRSGDAFGSRAIFDAGAPELPAFKADPGFVF